MPDRQVEPALRLAIDASALTANWQALDRLSGSARAGAVVKADAYGLGVTSVASTLWQAGCRDFLVAHWAEVPLVARSIAPSSIAVLHGLMSNDDAVFARAVGVRPVINSLSQARLWLETGSGPCDLMVDTGISRLGLAMSEIGDPLIARLEIDVLHSHLASADEFSPLNEQQRLRWVQAKAAIAHRRSALANSAGITLGAAYHGELTRPGLALYGGVPVPALGDHIRQVVTPEAVVMQLRELQPGDCVGYNATFVAELPMRVGVVSLGYADGYLRCWSGKGVMRSGGHALPVLGRVSMDMTVVDLSAAPQIREGDWISVDYVLPEAAAASGLSQYELLTLLGRRFAR